MYKEYFAIEKRIKQTGADIDRKELIADFTEGRTDSLRDLSPLEYRELCRSLNALLGHKQVPHERKNQMRRKLIATLCQCGFVNADNKPDMERIQNWCVQYGHAGKQLNDHTYKELQKLITQAEIMLKKHIERL
ncbi:MAG: hypothetical protein LC105_06060 [Chitinophagales bacterium]|nr:hypothetical protein [Chitinophagales bacterium]